VSRRSAVEAEARAVVAAMARTMVRNMVGGS
jgi:hypothetical protein